MHLTKSAEKKTDYQTFLDMHKDVFWRLNNLYWIIDKHGQRVRFRLNWAQYDLLKNMWFLNVVLKARQLGCTTGIDIFILDAALFNNDTRAGIIAHNQEDASAFFMDKVKYPYDNLPTYIKKERALISDSKRELKFSNNSSVRVGTSMRSGTLQYLHISEYGKICAKWPEKAKEIRTGALNTVAPGQFIFIESTAEGIEGDFYRICKDAKDKQDLGADLGKLDWRLHFFPWWKHPDYSIDERVVISQELEEYFNGLERDLRIELSPGQRAWYAAKYQDQQDEMKREYPSTFEEAFEASVIGAYYANQMAMVRQDKRITRVPHDPYNLVYTAWDLGLSDEMAIWFFQISPPWVHVIDYYEFSGEGISHYIDVLKNKPYDYGGHFSPHDIGQRDLISGQTRIARAKERGIKFTRIPRTKSIQDDIQEVRRMLGKCLFDQEKCSQGIKALDNFRKRWNDSAGCFSDTPLHNWASHGEAAFRSLTRAVNMYPKGIAQDGGMTAEKVQQMMAQYGPPRVGA